MNDEAIIDKIMEKIEAAERLSTDEAFQAANKIKRDDIVGAIMQIMDMEIKDENKKN